MPKNFIFLDKSRSIIIDLVCLISAVLTLVSACIGMDSLPYMVSLVGLSVVFISALLFNLNSKSSYFKFFVPVCVMGWTIYMSLCFGSDLGHQNYLIIPLVAMTIYAKKRQLKFASILVIIIVAVGINSFQQHNLAVFESPRYTAILATVNVINPLVIVAVMCWKLVDHVNLSYRIIAGQKLDLRASGRFKDQLLSILGHDMRAPFNSAKSLVMLLEEDALSAQERKTIIDILKTDIDLSLQTLDNILNWGSQTYFGSIKNAKAKKEKLDVSRIIHSTIEGFNHLATKKLIQFQNTLPSPTYIYADQQQLHFVLRNLTSNALKFSNSDSTITYRYTEDDQAVTVSIQDQGIGMELSMIDSLFNIETRTTAKGTANEKGSGLGLIFCKEFIENNNGKIWIQSEQLKGTTVYFSVEKPPIGLTDLPSL